MAVQPTLAGAQTLMSFAKGLDPDGKTAKVVELLQQTNEMLKDIMWLEGNLPTGHQVTIRVGLPTPVWRRFYKGVQPTRSEKAQITEEMGMLEDRSSLDVDVADLNGNRASSRLSEAFAHFEGMNQTMSTQLFYGDKSTNPDSFNGLTPRYSDKAAVNGSNILDAGGVGADNTSIWLIVWGAETIFGIFPKGSKAGIEHKDLGEIDAYDAAGAPYRALVDLWKWKAGLCVKDWRYAVRIGSIDVSDLRAQTGTQALTAATNILKLMALAMPLIPSVGAGKASFYANRTVIGVLSVMSQDKTVNVLSVQPGLDQLGKVSPGSASTSNLMFSTVPIKTSDGLLLTEALV